MPASSQACSNQLSCITGDPEFMGFLGQKFEVHGVPNSVFNIITSPLLQYNALFVYIGEKSDYAAKCNTTRTHPWTHAGTYLGTLGFKTVGGDKVMLASGSCLDGIKSVKVNGKVIKVGDKVELTGAESQSQSVFFKNQFQVELKFAEVELTLTNSDMFFNQQVAMTTYGEENLQTHGLLGQTWNDATYTTGGVRRVYEGVSSDYLVQDEDLFGDEFVYNRFPL